MTETSPQPELDAQVRQAHALFRDGEPALADALCRKVLAVQPNHVPALSVLGLVLYHSSRFGEALETFSTLTRLEPERWLHWMNVGTARRGLQDFDGALTA